MYPVVCPRSIENGFSPKPTTEANTPFVDDTCSILDLSYVITIVVFGPTSSLFRCWLTIQ